MYCRLLADGLLGLRGWQWLFLLEGISTIALGVWVWLTLAPAPLEAKFLSPSERDWVHQRVKSHKVCLPCSTPAHDACGTVCWPWRVLT